MDIIIEDAETLKFFTSEGQWAKNVAEGKHYAGATQAFNATGHKPIGKFNVAGYIVETKQLITLRNGRGTGS